MKAMDYWSPHEIQPCYFRAGDKTFLWLDYNEETALLSWSFTFLDLGMCHTLSGRATVSLVPNSPSAYMVNGQVHGTREQAMHAVFAGHYKDFIVQLYLDLGVEDEPV